MSSERLGKALAFALASTFVETKLLPKLGLGFLLESSTILNLPRGYGFVVLILGITYIWLLVTGISVAQARNKYIKQAEKDGEKDVDERYAYPNLYARKLSSTDKSAQEYHF